MRYFLFILLFVCGVFNVQAFPVLGHGLEIPAFATSVSDTVKQKTRDEKAVAARVEELRQALIDGDGQKLDNLTAAELSYGHSLGRIEDKVTFIAKLVSGESDFKTISISNQEIRMSGHVALVRHQLEASIYDGGKPGEVKLHVLLVWQKQHGNWKLLARQAVRISQ